MIINAQMKNAHGKLFGGNLMSEAFDLAWLTAYSHNQK